MVNQSFVSFVLLAVLSGGAQARIKIVERDGRALWGRRFGQENPAVIQQISGACNGAVCGVLAGKAIGTLLAASPECAQQDLADDIIDAARKQDPATEAKMIELAKTFRQVEKNTPPDFTKNPPLSRNSVFCQTPPRNSELVGLNQAQDPENDPNVFFDPACKCSVNAGSQPNTSPLGGGASNNTVTPETPDATPTDVAAPVETPAATTAVAAPTDVPATCPPAATVTVTVDPAATATATATDEVTSTDATPTATKESTDTAATPTATENPTETDAAAPPAATGGLPVGVDLGSCTDPTIRFAAGIEGRKETSFIPNSLKEFSHGSAQNSAIITQFICDEFVNSCKANTAAVAVCKEAKAAAAAAGAKSGGAADAFNAKFGVKTDFASVQALDNQGKPVKP